MTEPLDAQKRALVEELEHLPKVVDRAQRSGLERLVTMDMAKRRGLDREIIRRGSEGAGDSKRVRALRSKIDRLDMRQKEAADARERLKIDPPAPEPQAAFIYGRVVGDDGRPVEGVSMALLAGKEEALARAIPEARGNFEMKIENPEAIAEKLGGSTWQLVVSQEQSKPLASVSIAPLKNGQGLYREIVVGVSEKPGGKKDGDLPPGLRRPDLRTDSDEFTRLLKQRAIRQELRDQVLAEKRTRLRSKAATRGEPIESKRKAATKTEAKDRTDAKPKAAAKPKPATKADNEAKTAGKPKAAAKPVAKLDADALGETKAPAEKRRRPRTPRPRKTEE